ncbi:MAG: histidine kinase [Saprospiraceae bacterium]|nr:histidine kinase [Saprospiraceae bacterium]
MSKPKGLNTLHQNNQIVSFRIFYTVVLIFLSIHLFAQTTDFIFHHLGERQGLSNNLCFSLLKDSRDMLWIGTMNGLNRFDGVHFYNFKSGKDSSSLINNSIFDLCEDKEGNIWGGTASGIFCYLPMQNTFVNFTPPTYDFARGIKNIICDRNGDIWASSEWNILKLNKKKNKFEEIGPLTTNYDSLGKYSVRQNGMIEDPSGTGIWFATRSGLHFYNTKQAKFYSNKNRPGDAIFTNHGVAALSLSQSGHFWFFDNVTKDIISFDPKTHKILHQININAAISNDYGLTIFEDSNQMLWFSSWNGKIVVIDYKKGIINHVVNSTVNTLSIPGNYFWDILEDENHTIWLATPGGLAKCNYTNNVYNIVPITEKVPEIKSSFLGALTIDPRDNTWWLGAEQGNGGLLHYFPQTGKYYFYDFSKSIKNSTGQVPIGVFGIEFLNGKPYVCTHSGVWQVNETTKKVIPFEKKFNDWPHIVYNYMVENGDNVWFTTSDGFIKWNKKSNSAIKIKADADKLPDGQKPGSSKIYFDHKNRPWYIPAFGWLGQVKEDNRVELKYYIKNKEKELFGYLTSFDSDQNGNLWLASIGVGLYKYNTATEEMTLYNEPNQIDSRINYALSDSRGQIWTAAMNKFSVFNPDDKNISHFKIPKHENLFNYSNVISEDQNGNIITTMCKDVLIFMPDKLNLKPVMKSPLISMIKIAGREKLITNEVDLYLEPEENSLEINFGSLISHEIFPYSFEYTLMGSDKDWVIANNYANAIYNNLAPGNYTFKVKTVAKDKSWQSPERIIHLIIRTPFYKAAWFWILITCIIIGASVAFYRYRLSQRDKLFELESKAQMLEKEKTIVMYESLKQQLNPHFLFNSLTSLSGLIDTDQELAGSFLEQMSGIYRYILKNGDSETVNLKDEIQFAELYISLQQTRFKNGLQVNIDIDDEFMHYKIAPVTLQNLIENAIKHNIIDIDSPLVIDIYIEQDYIVVKNNLQKKNVVETSNKKGLVQFITLYKYLTNKPIKVEETEHSFCLKIPLI